MVIAAVTVLAVLVTEFTYTAQVNARLAYDGADQLKAEYLAKTGLKLSMLRLKAYQNVKNALGSMGAASMVPKSMLEKIWSFPFMYPLPTNLPGMSPQEKDRINQFQKDSTLEGSFTAVIESESSKYNINSVLASFAPTGQSAQTGANPTPTATATATPTPTPSPSPSPGANGFNAQAARQALHDYMLNTLNAKFEADPDFRAEYRDFRFEDFFDHLLSWIDRSYQRQIAPMNEAFTLKGAPMYSISELHMIEPLDDPLYNLFAPTLTTSMTPGIDVNTMNQDVLRALVPGITDDDVKAFFDYRDDPTQDNMFKDPKDFFKYLQDNVSVFHNDPKEMERYQNDLQSKNIRLVTDEQTFKITVRAQVHNSSKTLEAWVTMTQPATGTSQTQGTPPPAITGPAGGTQPAQPDSGLKITFMRIF